MSLLKINFNLRPTRRTIILRVYVVCNKFLRLYVCVGLKFFSKFNVYQKCWGLLLQKLKDGVFIELHSLKYVL